jgi:hypothetical protein
MSDRRIALIVGICIGFFLGAALTYNLMSLRQPLIDLAAKSVCAPLVQQMLDDLEKVKAYEGLK